MVKKKPPRKRAEKWRVLRGRQGRKLSPRQERFTLEYMIDLNATQAAIRAGYKAANANVVGPKLLTHPNVAKAITKAQARMAARSEMKADEVNERLAAMARGEINSKETEERGWEKHQLKALETLGHHLGLRKSVLKLDIGTRPDLSKLSEEEIETLLRLEEKAGGNAGDAAELEAGE